MFDWNFGDDWSGGTDKFRRISVHKNEFQKLKQAIERRGFQESCQFDLSRQGAFVYVRQCDIAAYEFVCEELHSMCFAKKTASPCIFGMG